MTTDERPSAIELVLGEQTKRFRAGFGTAYDDKWQNGELMAAAECYLATARGHAQQFRQMSGFDESPESGQFVQRRPVPVEWPLDDSMWQPGTLLESYARGCSFILAELERRFRHGEESQTVDDIYRLTLKEIDDYLTSGGYR